MKCRSYRDRILRRDGLIVTSQAHPVKRWTYLIVTSHRQPVKRRTYGDKSKTVCLCSSDQSPSQSIHFYHRHSHRLVPFLSSSFSSSRVFSVGSPVLSPAARSRKHSPSASTHHQQMLTISKYSLSIDVHHQEAVTISK